MKTYSLLFCFLFVLGSPMASAQSDSSMAYLGSEVSIQLSFLNEIAQSMEEKIQAYQDRKVERQLERAEKRRVRSRTWQMRFQIAPFVSGIGSLAYNHPNLLPQLFHVLNTNRVERESWAGRTFRGAKESYRKINLCYYLGGVSGFHHTDEEWEKLSEACQTSLETELTEEQVANLREVLFATNFHDVLKGLGEYEREDVTLAGLCHENPISYKIYSQAQEDYYCGLNLRFRGCNLLYQRLYSENSQIAFEACSVNRPEGFSMNEAEQAEYQDVMARYLQGLSSLRYENHGFEN